MILETNYFLLLGRWPIPEEDMDVSFEQQYNFVVGITVTVSDFIAGMATNVYKLRRNGEKFLTKIINQQG